MTFKAILSSLGRRGGKAEVKCMPHLQSSTAVFVVHCKNTKRAVLIDPCADYTANNSKLSYQHSDKVLEYITQSKLTVDKILETHAHADHLSSAQYMKKNLPNHPPVGIGADITQIQQIFAKLFNLEGERIDASLFDETFTDGQEFSIGDLKTTVASTPGHTPACVSYMIGEDALFVGDTLFQYDMGTARCDFPGGSPKQMWKSVQGILSLPKDTRVFVGHDYPPPEREFNPETTVGGHLAKNKMVNASATEESYTQARAARDKVLAAPQLLLPSIQVNIRAGHLPAPENNKTSYLKIPIRS
eukprot:g11521.t1